MKILILYSGHICSTKKAAYYIADKLGTKGHDVDVTDTVNKPKIDFKTFDSVIFGSNMRMFSPNKRFKRYARKFNRSHTSAKAYLFLIGADLKNSGKNTIKAKQFINGCVEAVFGGGELIAEGSKGFAKTVIQDMLSSMTEKGETIPVINYSALDKLVSAI